MGGVTCLLLLLWAGVTVSTVLDLQKRIIGGHECKKNERLYHVQLQDSNYTFRCGGSLISDQWILTAAHCWVENLKVVLGVHSGTKIVQNIEESVIYKDHDIMLLKLPGPSSITPVPLPDCTNTPKKGNTVQIAGHGDTTAHPSDKKKCRESPTLQCANTTVVDCPTYSNMHTFCGQRPGVDTCPGDSGGGVVYNGMIYGVHKCGGTYVCTQASRFMDVCNYMDWINDITKSTLTRVVDNIKACFGCG